MSEMMSVELWSFMEFTNGVIVGNNRALKAPFRSQHIAQQPAVGVRGYAVDLVIGRHDTHCSCVANGCLERKQKHFAQYSFRHIYGRAIRPRFRLAMGGKVFERGDYVPFVLKLPVTLKSANGGDTHLRDQVRVFAKRLLDSSPARVTCDVDDRS